MINTKQKPSLIWKVFWYNIDRAINEIVPIGLSCFKIAEAIIL